ncbi:MAG TPA: NAD kinase [Flavobacteriaceae bacterium]|jgi:NAD+ kinase|nr:NAD kinase [Flavobacteriaceae bacterium]|tara:strand:+ start:2333 stop:3220 length:888 start_codon:yes stop_codon:yes gene_type:complete
MKVALFISRKNELSVDCCIEIINILGADHDLSIDEDYKKYFSKNILSQISFYNSSRKIDKSYDFLFSIGGDGTILRSITFIKDSNIPILGINTGRLGFLTGLQKESLKHGLELLKNNKFRIVKRSSISVSSENNNIDFGESPYALNEITIHRKDTTSLLNISCKIDNMYHTDYWSDGLIISTPTGSTGYSLSNGGPIVSPESGIIILNPISPHNISMRPFLIQDTSSINITVKEEDYSLSLDSRIYSIDKKSVLLIKKSDFTINTIEFADDNFFKKLRDRLFWGQDMRNTNTIKR